MKRLETGVSELDLVLGGGLEPGSLVVLAGPPGVGKTILAQQICFNLSTPERKAIYYTTLSESHAKIIRHIEQFEFFDADAVGSRVEFVHLAELAQDGGVGLDSVVSEVVAASFEAEPMVVVIDSAKALRDFTDEASLRSSLYHLASRVAHTETVLFFLGEYTVEDMEGSPEFSLADSIIQLAYESREPVDRRWLRVVKMRGGKHLQGRQSFCISDEGIDISPRLEELVPGDAEESRARSSMGVPTLDSMMDGGPYQTDSTVVLGPSGCGKTALGIGYVAKGLEEGGRCLFISFQESEPQILTKAASFDLDLQPAVDSGQLVIHHVAPGDLDLDRVGAALRAELARGGVRRVLVDSLAEMVFAGARRNDSLPTPACLWGSCAPRGRDCS